MNKLDYNYLAELLYPHIKTTPEDMEKKYPEDTDWTEDQMERIIEASATLAEKQTEDALKALESLGGLGL